MSVYSLPMPYGDYTYYSKSGTKGRGLYPIILVSKVCRSRKALSADDRTWMMGKGHRANLGWMWEIEKDLCT